MNNLSNFDELDRAIEAMLASSELPLASHEPTVTDLLQIASDLRQLPRPDFKMRLKTELDWVASARPLSPGRQPQAMAESDILLSLFGNGYGTYPVRRVNFAVSLALHAAAMVLVAMLGVMALKNKPKDHVMIGYKVVPLGEYIPPAGAPRPHGGGGGGDNDKINASNGALPKAVSRQLVPPVVVVRNSDPKLSAEPTVVAPDLQLPQTRQIGDPLSTLITSSNGIGIRAGIGSGGGGGVGPGSGPGFGPGNGGNFGGGAFTVGNGVSAPRVIYDPEPEYSPEARAAKHQGTVVLWAVIAPDGRPRELRVERPLGMGLDEKALEAVRTWRFEPALKDGKPVPVMIEVEVSFHLY
jgi:TonB family protein